MTLPATIASAIEAAHYDQVEDEWLQRVAASPTDVETFASAARALAGAGEDERARFLLELLDDALRERGLWAARLTLLRRAGSLLLDPEAIHPQILETLRHLHPESTLLDEMAEALGLHRATHDLPKTWEKVARLRELMALDVGTLVAMDGQGVGRIVEANFPLESFRVEFAGRTLNVRFRGATKALEPLPPGHILRRKIEEPDVLKALAKNDPPELLHAVLASRGRAMTAGEIKADLSGVITDSRWTSFWSAARRHPQVVVTGAGARQTYAWAESSGQAHQAVWDSFATADVRKKIDLLRREGGRADELVDRMAEDLERLGAAAAADDPGLAFEVRGALERAGREPQAPELAPAELAGGTRKRAEALLAGVEDRTQRERAAELVRAERDDWRQVYLARLSREEDSRVLDLLFDALNEDSGEGLAPEVSSWVESLLAQPHRQPAAFLWLAERAGSEEMLRRNPLRLLQQILSAPVRNEFAPFRPRLRALLDTGGTVPRLLASLSEDQAAAALEAVHRAGMLENYERDALSRALETRFASLRGEQSAADVLYALPESIAAKRAELDRIAKVELPANRKAIEEARAMGDLRENFEYKSARQRHEYLSSRAIELNAELGRARPLDLAQVDASQVRVGTRVRLAGSDGERELTVLGPWESDPDQGVISYQSELGESLLGKAVGDEVTVDGGRVRITAVEVATAPAR
ncbi:MAG TPA: GreA/GreB family elongation factor [Thermoanaerobaculia bacterium]|nr:GreA/GreB family elongation factor [Thermoanaerobaculia bacterium]